MRTARIGLALGSGSARGWAHIGVIRALHAAGVMPDFVCGTSIGALVGAAYAAGELDRFEPWVRSLGVRDVVGFMDVSLDGGLLKGERLMEFFRRNFVDRRIEDLDLPFAAVATALHTGAEVWLREDSTLDAVRASIALPGLFAPVMREDELLVDGGLVNPVPVSLARAMGADRVIAVDLNSDILGRRLQPGPLPAANATLAGTDDPLQPRDWMRRMRDNLGALWPPGAAGDPDASSPSMLDVLTSSLNVMQVRITRSRMAGDPPDLTITPRLARLGLLDFHRAGEAIEEGRRAVERARPALEALRG